VVRPETVLLYLRRLPFRAFRVHVTDGSAYEIRHRDWALVSHSALDVAIPSSEDPELFHIMTVALLHISRIELLSTSPVFPPA
jgi:hypothetical protein